MRLSSAMVRAVAVIWAAVVVIAVATLAAAKRHTDLEAAANAVLATASGANDQIAQVRLEQIYAEQRILHGVVDGLILGVLLGLLVAVAATAAAVAGRRRSAGGAGLGVGVPAPRASGAGRRRTTVVVLVLGVVLLGAGGIVMTVGVRGLGTDDGLSATRTLALPVGHALMLAGAISMPIGVLAPAIREPRRRARMIAAAALTAGYAVAWLCVLGALNIIDGEYTALQESGRQAGTALQDLIGRQVLLNSVNDTTLQAALLTGLGMIAVAGVAARRER